MTSTLRLRTALLAALASAVGCTAAVGDDGTPSDDGRQVPRSALALSCTTRIITVVQQGNENRFRLDASAVALNPAIPVNQVCNQVRNDVRNRGLDPECGARCTDAEELAQSSGIRGFQGVDAARLQSMRELADDLNGILGNETSFGGADTGAGDGDDDADVPVQCNAKELQVIVQGKEQRFGFDNRQVALNPAIPMQNICNALQGSCRTVCDAAREDAIATGVKGTSGDIDLANLQRMGKLADDFNRRNGKASNFENAFGAPAANDDGEAAGCKARRALQVIVQGKEQRFGFDNRQVALNPGIPMQNICNDFGQDQVCRAACDAARQRALATGVKGISGELNLDNLRRMGQLADDFNLANGIVSAFAANAIFN
jgi:hypothetical protein